MPKTLRIFVHFYYACVRSPRTRPFSWIGKAGAGVFSVEGYFDGEWKYYIQVIFVTDKIPTILVTGSAGFIGSNLVLRLLESNKAFFPCLTDILARYGMAGICHNSNFFALNSK